MRHLLPLILLIFSGPALSEVAGYGKMTAPIGGGIGVSAVPKDRFQSLQGMYSPSFKMPDGRPCISVHPSNRPQIGKPNIFDQIILIQNSCGQTIKLRICFFGSSDCIEASIGGYQKTQRILGISAGSRAFRYEYREVH